VATAKAARLKEAKQAADKAMAQLITVRDGLGVI
jgi:hypothetical protein